MLWTRSFSVSFRAATKSSTIKQYVNDPVKLIVIPITNKQSFVYFKYSNELLNADSAFVRYESKISRKAAKIWQSMQDSPRSINKKIVSMVNKLMDQNPWTENALQTIPSESYILKQVENGSRKVTLAEYMKSKVDDSMAAMKPKPICVYYPGSVLDDETIIEQFKRITEEGKIYHKKYASLSLLGIPFTLPLVLIPVIPNVPGFYLAYRAYCNFKAYFGARHLESLITNEDQNFEFIDLEQYSAIFENIHVTKSDEERLLLTAPDLERIMDNLEIHEIASDLKKALRQEAAHLHNKDD